MNTLQQIYDMVHRIIEEYKENPPPLSNAKESDRIYYDLEAMRELQRINPYCRIYNEIGGNEVPIAVWIEYLEMMQK